MGVDKHTSYSWYLVGRKVVETRNAPAFKWCWNDEYKESVIRPAYVPDVAGTVMPLARYADRYDS